MFREAQDGRELCREIEAAIHELIKKHNGGLTDQNESVSRSLQGTSVEVSFSILLKPLKK